MRRKNPYYSGPAKPHFDGKRFFNPGGEAPLGFRDVLKWQTNGQRAKWPDTAPSPFGSVRPEPGIDGNALRVTMVGHATLLVQVAGLAILTDPVWSQRVSPFSFAGPKRINPPGITFDHLPPIDIVLVSHNHYDHLDTATLKRLWRAHDPLVVTPLGNDVIMRRAVPKMRIAALDWHDTVDAGNGTTVHVEPTHHWSARGVGDRRMALWSSFVVAAPAGKVYFAGDTGFHGGENYRALAERHGPMRLAILPIGAYAPRWFMKSQHQDPDEAVRGMLLSRAEHAIGCHWGTFQLTDEPIDEPRQRLIEALRRHGVEPERFRPMLPGEVWDVPPGPTTT